ncbi:MAG: M14 family zinc carboxypeptidase [Bdellovibrionota bacterium]
MAKAFETKVFGHSSTGLPILSYHFKGEGPEVLVLGGVHGDEIEGIWGARFLLDKLIQSYDFKLNLTVVPEFNVEGCFDKTRGNKNGVDLNRNLPTKDWSPEVKTPRYNPGPSALSENENKALVSYIETKKPVFILSLHSWHPVLNVNGNCLEQANTLAALTGYKIDTDIGYPTPGCLGSYAGLERQSPTLTYEIERGLAIEPIRDIHVPAMIACLKTTEELFSK